MKIAIYKKKTNQSQLSYIKTTYNVKQKTKNKKQKKTKTKTKQKKKPTYV